MINLPDKIYYVSCPTDRTVMIAMNMRENNGAILWFDTLKERIMKVKKILHKSPERLIFERGDGDGGIYTFVPLTLEIYEKNVKRRVLIPRDFDNKQEMLSEFRKTMDGAW